MSDPIRDAMRDAICCRCGRIERVGCCAFGPPEHDWPEWSAPANTIRWAERLLGKPLGKESR